MHQKNCNIPAHRTDGSIQSTTMMKAFVSIAILAAALDSIALAKPNDHSRAELYIRKLGKSGKSSDKSGKAVVHPNLHHNHGYHPHHIGKADKGETGGKSAKGIHMDPGWAAVGDDDHSAGDDGYEWSDVDHNATSSIDVHYEDDDHSAADDDDDAWWADDGHYHGKSGKGAKSSKGGKSAKVGKSDKAHKSSKGMHHHDDDNWGGWSHDHTDMPSPVPTPCGKAGKDCPEKPDWMESPAPTPCGKAGKECPEPAPKPAPQTLPPICLTIPCSINGVLVSPTDVISGSELTTQPPVPSPIGTLTTKPPIAGGTDPTDVIGVPPPTPPTALVPITVAPSTPTESGYPTWVPTSVPTTDIHFLTESANWFQTGKAYEVDSYTRARMGDLETGFAFAKTEDTSGSRRLVSSLIGGFGMLIVLLQVV